MSDVMVCGVVRHLYLNYDGFAFEGENIQNR